GSMRGRVYAIDAATGCLYWSIATPAGGRTAVRIGQLPNTSPPRFVAYFCDIGAHVHAGDARTGEKLWSPQFETHPMAGITGGLALHDGHLYIPVSSFEEGSGGQPSYQCCTFRGSVVALDAATGKLVWKAYTISQKPTKREKNKLGVQLWGPSGA